MQRLNKPRAFLSHSKKDVSFIEKIASDLRKCQIDCWLDTEEIRAGKSWLKVIFEDGIPTCDIVIVYLTENSIKSKMVEKEIDAALIEQLSEKGIAFLPYVNESKLREKLRSDIRALHCLEWNSVNYHEILPTVVAEIWHSYMDRVVNIAVSHEKNRRLELELEVRKQKDIIESSPFSSSEQTDFNYIYKMMSKSLEITFDVWVEEKISEHIGVDVFKVPYFDSIIYYLLRGYNYFDKNYYAYELLQFHKSKGFQINHPKSRYGNSNVNYNIMIDLRSYGLTCTVQEFLGRKKTVDKFSEKMYRFHYWLGYNNLVHNDFDIEYLEFRESSGK